jgi:hypothetical protein
MGLLSSFVAGILAIVFGIVTLVRVGKTGERGTGMAITGIVLGVMWTALTVLFIALGIYGASHGNVGSLQAGACFDSTQPGQVSAQVRYVSSCSQPHNGQVVGTFVLAGNAWPGATAVSREAAAGCTAMIGGILHQQGPGNGIRWVNYYPGQQAWSSGTRTVSCVLVDPDAQHTGSLLTGG